MTRGWLRDARLALARLPSLRMGGVPDAPALPVRDPWPGDPARAARLLKGELELGGASCALRPGHFIDPQASGALRAAARDFTWQRFRSSRLPATRRLDLHGHTAQRAFLSLSHFLRAAHAEHVCCVEVITGRGGPEGVGVLRRELPFWLNRPELRPLVLAAAHPHPGNEGAVRLLLLRIRS